MTQQENGRVGLREFLELRFDGIDKRLDDYCDRQERVAEDHEKRLRSLEKQTPWRTLAEATTGVVAMVAVALGLKQP